MQIRSAQSRTSITIPALAVTCIVQTWPGLFMQQAVDSHRKKFERRSFMLATSQKRAGPDASFNMRIELPQRRSARPLPSTPSTAPLWTARQKSAARRGSASRSRCTALNAVRRRSTANAPALRSASLCHVCRLRVRRIGIMRNHRLLGEAVAPENWGGVKRR